MSKGNPDGWVATEGEDHFFIGPVPKKTGSTWSTGWKNNKALMPYNTFPKLKDTDEPIPVYITLDNPDDVAKLVEAAKETVKHVVATGGAREIQLEQALKAFKPEVGE